MVLRGDGLHMEVDDVVVRKDHSVSMGGKPEVHSACAGSLG